MTDVLTALGGDIAFTVSLSVSDEVMGAGREQQLPPILLVTMLLFGTTVTSWGSSLCKRCGADHANLLGFASMILSVTHRIIIATTVQVLTRLAASSNARRTNRVLSLIGVAVFFVFLQRVSVAGILKKRA